MILNTQQGVVSISIDDKEVAKLGPGRSMCEFALISHSPSLYTITAKTDVVLLSLDRDCYRYISSISYNKTKSIIKKTLLELPLFCDCDPAQLNKLSESAFLVRYNKGEIIFLKGSPERLFYIILRGTVKICTNSNICHSLGIGDYFGELSLFTGETIRTASVTAIENCILLVFDRLSFQDVIGNKSIAEYLHLDIETY